MSANPGDALMLDPCGVQPFEFYLAGRFAMPGNRGGVMKKTSQRSLLFRQNVGRTEEEWAHFLDGYRQALSLRLASTSGRGGRGGDEGLARTRGGYLRRARLNRGKMKFDSGPQRFQTERTLLMENIIYNELVARGCNVDVGVVEVKVAGENGKRVLRQYEIDFVVNTGFEKLYIQSAFELSDEAKRAQETFSLRKTRDSFRKLVVVGGDQPFFTDEDGISFVGIIPFLLDKSILSDVMSKMK